MLSTFTFNGHSSDEFGVYIERKPDLNRSGRKFSSASVPGRNGNIYQLENAWEEVVVSYDVFAGGMQDGSAVASFTDIMEWLNSADGYAVLTDTYDPTHYRMAVFVDATPITSKWHQHGRATISFRCRPERYIVTNPLTPSSGGTIANNTNHVAEPVITLTGSGARSMIDLTKSMDTSHNGTYTAISSLIPSMSSKVWLASAYYNSVIIDSTKGTLTNITNTDGKIDFSISDTGTFWGIGTIQAVNGDTDYTLSCQGYDGGDLHVLFANKSGNNEITGSRYVGEPTYQTIWRNIKISFHTPADCGYIFIIFNRTSWSHISTQNYKSIMLNQGTTALPFREYSATAPSSLTINDTTISFNGAFASGEIDCERENIIIDGADSNSGASVTDQYGNLSVDYLQFKTGNNSISWTGEISAVSIDPRFWEL